MTNAHRGKIVKKAAIKNKRKYHRPVKVKDVLPEYILIDLEELKRKIQEKRKMKDGDV